jgi:hypothetical protein
MDAHPRPRVASAWWRSLILVVAAVLAEIGAPYQPAAALSTAKQPGVAMKTFVIIFRQGPRPLTESEAAPRRGSDRLGSRCQRSRPQARSPDSGAGRYASRAAALHDGGNRGVARHGTPLSGGRGSGRRDASGRSAPGAPLRGRCRGASLGSPGSCRRAREAVGSALEGSGAGRRQRLGLACGAKG